ncbi:MAG TPA: endonuclease domain-containing protein [Fibrobacteria bacterium]|nr:endonuclease domain-containing protein [Fibrobacteria bacterium]
MRESRTEFSRRLRRRSTPTEEVVWELVRDRRMLGLKFRRQHPVGPFIADFYCAELSLVLELDGNVHRDRIQREKDRYRDDWMAERGILVIRVWNRQADEENLKRLITRFLPRCR